MPRLFTHATASAGAGPAGLALALEVAAELHPPVSRAPKVPARAAHRPPPPGTADRGAPPGTAARPGRSRAARRRAARG
ncbi:hypothetical protein ABZ023_24325 [Streptomyces sp. NPDC006367]|uniref:hypothetical protein n=1 Tax=unclassified Streptomyces TaxID=2593676 RepID=UPI0033A2633F